MANLLLRFERNGKHLPITDFALRRGIAFGGERLSRNRQFGVRYGWEDLKPGERRELEEHQKLNDLEWNQLALRVTRTSDGDLKVTARKGSLPRLRYRVGFKIEDMEIEDARRRIDLTDTILGRGSVPHEEVLKVKDVGAIELQRTPSRFEPRIKELVQRAGSGADGKPLAKWILDDTVRAGRRACLLNILAKLRSIEDGVGGALVEHVRAVFLVDSDRVYAEVERSFLDTLRRISAAQHAFFFPENDNSSSTHDLLLDGMRLAGGSFPGSPADWYVLRDFRQVGRPSLQAVVATPLKAPLEPGEKYEPDMEDPDGRHFVDLDIDLGVVEMDLLGAFTHFAELILPARTDHLDVGRKLAEQDGVGRFIYYRPA